MTEQHFQTPPVPPHAPSFDASKPMTARPDLSGVSHGGVTDLPPDNFAAALKLSPNIYRTKVMALVLGGTVILGMILGALFFGGSSTSQKQAPQGLTGVVPNPDWRGLPRCGMVSETAPCAVYLVNHTRNDHYAEYFFDEAVKLTNRQKYLITIENPHYAKTRIPPGYIAQIRIPALR